MTALTVPNRHRSLFAAFRGGVDDPVAATDEAVPAETDNESQIAPALAADSPEPTVEAAQPATSVARPDAPSKPVSPAAEPARGGVFSGTKAQIRLTPAKASTHPTSGRRGDLFVDNAGRLWFCRTGGKGATWKQVKLV